MYVLICRELPFSVIRLYRKWLWYDLSMAVAVRSWYSEKNHIHFSVNHLFWLPKPFMFGAATEMISGRVRICGKFSQELSANSSWNGFKWIEDDMNMKHTPIAFELVKRELNIFEMRSLNVETVFTLMDYDHYDQLQENELLFALAFSGNGVKWYFRMLIFKLDSCYFSQVHWISCDARIHLPIETTYECNRIVWRRCIVSYSLFNVVDTTKTLSLRISLQLFI